MQILLSLYAAIANSLCALRARLLWLLGREDDEQED
jgi:hypothetical protein